jgi:hypothetical protein
MTQVPTQGQVIQVKPAPDVYTLLLLVAILVLAVAVGVSLYYLMANPPVGYGLTFGDLFGHVKVPGGK